MTGVVCDIDKNVQTVLEGDNLKSVVYAESESLFRHRWIDYDVNVGALKMQDWKMQDWN